ncbi:unnamed protein product, partial [Polarella glacialis]
DEEDAEKQKLRQMAENAKVEAERWKKEALSKPTANKKGGASARPDQEAERIDVEAVAPKPKSGETEPPPARKAVAPKPKSGETKPPPARKANAKDPNSGKTKAKAKPEKAKDADIDLDSIDPPKLSLLGMAGGFFGWGRK